ncbi:MAG: histidine phosphatase family protein [Streptococcaceae bacterium]|nr:histidine phosphatase family protein [Streptococcaceae bacterium]
MKKHIYIMRHGETLFNAQHRTQGWCDSPLSERGRADSIMAYKFMKNFPIEFDAFYSSTSERASDTLEIVFPKKSYQRLKSLKEMNFGAFEGQPTYLEVWDKATFYEAFGGETRASLVDRVEKAFLEILSTPKNQNVFCVGHGAASWFFLEDKVKRTTAMPIEGFQNLDLMHLTFDTKTREFEFCEIVHTL